MVVQTNEPIAPSLIDLPSELLVLIAYSLFGSQKTQSLAALEQACRTFRQLPEIKSMLELRKAYLEEIGVDTISRTLNEYLGGDPNFVVPIEVTTIGLKAFRDNANLKTVTLHKNITNIEESAFWGCTNLESVSMHKDMKINVLPGFWGCHALKEMTWPDVVTKVPRNGFRNCCSLSVLTIPTSVTSMGRYAFERCGQLTTLNAPSSLDMSDAYLPEITQVYTGGECSAQAEDVAAAVGSSLHLATTQDILPVYKAHCGFSQGWRACRIISSSTHAQARCYINEHAKKEGVSAKVKRELILEGKQFPAERPTMGGSNKI